MWVATQRASARRAARKTLSGRSEDGETNEHGTAYERNAFEKVGASFARIGQELTRVWFGARKCSWRAVRPRTSTFGHLPHSP